MSYWNHRVIENDGYYAIHEVYYKDNGEMNGYTKHPVPVRGESIEALRTVLEQMLGALDKEVITIKQEE